MGRDGRVAQASLMEPGATIFVTGATGFIGTRLVQTLLEQGHHIRALTRRPHPQPPLGFGWEHGGPLDDEHVELVLGDITDRESIRRGMTGCSHVFHLAAYAKNWARQRRTFFDMNVQGMRNVVETAGELGVERIVWTSTIVTLGPTRRGELADESTPRIMDRCFTEYERTKAQAEREALRYAEEGIPVVIVNPTRVYGPGHFTEANALSLLIDQYDRGEVPILLNYGVNVGNYVFVEDVVRGHVLAMHKGRVGQCYILGGENVTLREFFRTIDRVSGKRHFQLPLWYIAPMLYAVVLQKRAEWLGIYPRITPGWIRTFIAEWAHSSEKAERELGYQWTPLSEGVRITYEWLMRVRREQS